MQVKPLRFPAEWEPQSAVMVAWPHAGTDWAKRLEAVETTYIALLAAITRFQNALICVADARLEAHVRQSLTTTKIDLDRIRFVQVPYNDTWLRDSGPITLRSDTGFQLLDFHFTAWGGKFEASLDDQLISTLFNNHVFNHAQHQRIEFALEGGAIETDGAGTLLSTWHCLHERHPALSRTALSDHLETWLHQDRMLWLNHGYLEGDDTDAHIDTLARFASGDSIVYQGCDDPTDSHYLPLQKMAEELATFRTRDGKAYHLFELPWPEPILDEGRRLAASYANFLIINGAVLMPSYGDKVDTSAAEILARAFPNREIVSIPCRSLIWQNGSLHCLTMQLPQGLVT